MKWTSSLLSVAFAANQYIPVSFKNIYKCHCPPFLASNLNFINNVNFSLLTNAINSSAPSILCSGTGVLLWFAPVQVRNCCIPCKVILVSDKVPNVGYADAYGERIKIATHLNQKQVTFSYKKLFTYRINEIMNKQNKQSCFIVLLFSLFSVFRSFGKVQQFLSENIRNYN